MKKYDITLTTYAILTADEGVLEEYVEKWKDDQYSHFDNVEELVELVAMNGVANGVEDQSRMDGFADVEEGQVRVWVADIDVDDIWEVK